MSVSKIDGSGAQADGGTDGGSDSDATIPNETSPSASDGASEADTTPSDAPDSTLNDGPDAGDAPVGCTLTGPCIASACENGQWQCEAGVMQCVPTTAVSNGVSCDGGICLSGACSPCAQSQDCTPDGSCIAMSISCTVDGSTCGASGNVQNGTQCGMGRYCDNGSCEACTNGNGCTPPANLCHNGSITCVGGMADCIDQNTNASDGTMCAPGMYCLGGNCMSCPQGQTCTPSGNACQTGTYSCSTGQAVCVAAGDQPPGQPCGAGGQCNGSGTCETCTGPCSGPNACSTYSNSCTNGAQSCSATGFAAGGTSCNGGLGSCDGSGNCVTCGSTCTGANPCGVYKYSCGAGAPVCILSSMASAGTSCGAGGECTSAGQCVVCGDPCTGTVPCYQAAWACTGSSVTCVSSATTLPAGNTCTIPGGNEGASTCNGRGTCLCTGGLPLTNLSTYYSFDEPIVGANPTPDDSQFGNNVGNRSGTINQAPGITGLGYSLSDSWVAMKFPSNIVESSHTLCIWVKPIAPALSSLAYPIMVGGDPTNCGPSQCGIDFYSAQVAPPSPPNDGCFPSGGVGGFLLDHWGTSCDVATFSIPTTSFTFVCFDYSGSLASGSTTTYVNGTSLSVASIVPYSFPDGYSDFTIGVSVAALGEGYPAGTSTTSYYNGMVDEFTYWNLALSAAQVQSLYNNGAGCAAR